MKKLITRSFVLSLLVFTMAVCQAAVPSGDSQSVKRPHFPAEQTIALAQKLEQTLQDEGVKVAIVGRIGRPPADLPEGMRFTHVGFAVYSEIPAADGRRLHRYAMYNLYQKRGKPNLSELVRDDPPNFFAGVTRLEAGVIIPSPQLQQRLLDVIMSPAYAKLHDPHYSLIANPYTEGRQNCTEFVLDVLNAAMYQTSDLRILKTVTKNYFVAQPVKVNPLKVMLGAVFNPEISISDQQGMPETATFETLGKYLETYDSGSKMIEVLP